MTGKVDRHGSLEHAFVHTTHFDCSNIPRSHVRGSVGQGSRTSGGPVLAAAGRGREQGSREDVRFAAKEPSSATLREHRDGNGLQISTPRRHSGRVVVSSVRGSVSVGLGGLVQQIKQVLWAANGGGWPWR